ncbi:MAG: hypothetical protein IPL46_33825 [Saprospiraceae bacterium]|nr:hypothetical protein [Saprospiraceae bacterium]
MSNTEKLKANYLPYLFGIVCAIGCSSCSKRIIYNAPSSLSQEYIFGLSAEKQMAYGFVTALKSDSNLFDSLLSESFYSRDQCWEGQKAEFFNKRSADNSFSQISPVRILQDKSLVALHSRMLGDTLRFRWDILRIEHQKIQEHWSNVNDSIGLNPDKHSEVDGPTISNQLEKTDTNRALITRFIDQCMIREDGGASKFFDFGLYIQHNRDVGDGLSGLVWAMIKMKIRGRSIKFKDNCHVIAEGNLVLSASEGYVGDQKTAFLIYLGLKKIRSWNIGILLP